jgi:serine phosphatase RsbU (regulator of sigma subunit)
VPAALLMARLCAEARYCLVTNTIPSDAVRMLNRQLSRQNLNFFITFALCVIDPLRHEMIVVNAGHMPPLLRRAGGGAMIPLGMDVAKPPLGIDATIPYQQCVLPLQTGDIIMLYTDGVSEARNPHGEMYGIERLQDTCTRANRAEELVKCLLGDVQQFMRGARQEDDMCVVALSRNV